MSTPFVRPEPAGQLAKQILLLAAEHEQVAAFLEAALPLLLAAAGADDVTPRRAERGKWLTLTSSGLRQEPPQGLLAEVLDREQALCEGP